MEKNEIAIYKNEIRELTADKQILKNLLEITFKGLKPEVALTAMLEGRMVGYTIQNFLQKDVYAIPFKDSYSLITSIGYARKIGQRSGVVGVSAPIYTEDEKGNILTCEITVKKYSNGIIGDFTALVYFEEYYKPPFKTKTGYEIKSLWDTKPRTMIAKIAEMHALRKACPEELKQAYIEEEFQKDAQVVVIEEQKIEEKKEEDTKSWKQKMADCKTLEELQKVWSDAPATIKEIAEDYKNELKIKLTTNSNEVEEVVEK